jgi:hypothetical protein
MRSLLIALLGDLVGAFVVTSLAHSVPESALARTTAVGMEFGKGFGSYYSGWADWVKEYPEADRTAYPALFLMPKDCYEIRLDKPLGIAFIENDDGGVVVEDLVEGGNAAKSGVIKPGDVLLGSTACMGRDGTFERKMIPVRYQDFDTISDDDPAVEPAAASFPITSLGVLSRLCSIPVLDSCLLVAVGAIGSNEPRFNKQRKNDVILQFARPSAPYENDGDPFNGGSRGVKDYLESLKLPVNSPWLNRV